MNCFLFLGGIWIFLPYFHSILSHTLFSFSTMSCPMLTCIPNFKRICPCLQNPEQIQMCIVFILKQPPIGHFEFPILAKLHPYGMLSYLATCSLNMKTIRLILWGGSYVHEGFAKGFVGDCIPFFPSVHFLCAYWSIHYDMDVSKTTQTRLLGRPTTAYAQTARKWKICILQVFN